MSEQKSKTIFSTVVGFLAGAMTAFLVHPIEADLKSRFEHCDAVVSKLVTLPNLEDQKQRDKLSADIDNEIYRIGDLSRLPFLTKSYAEFGQALKRFNKSLSEGTTDCTHTCVREAASNVREACTEEFSTLRWLKRRFVG